MKTPTPKSQEQYKTWVKKTIKKLYKLEGIKLIEESEQFFAICHDHYAEAEIKHTQKTNDKIIEKEYAFLRDLIMPILKEASAKIAEKVIQKKDYPKQFEQYVKEARITHELFHPDIPELQKQESQLETEYTKKFGSLTIKVQGKIYPITKTGKFLESFDKNIRKEAWQSMKQSLITNREFFENLFVDLIDVRTKIARKAKCKNYVEYQFKKKMREYSVEDCYDYHEAVKKYVTPKITELQKKRKKFLKTDKLYPCDTSFSIHAKYELFPFESHDEKKFVHGIKQALYKISPDISNHFQRMCDNKRFDLIGRAYKAPGGYNMPFILQPYSFIFMNANGTHRDLNTLAHEEGHAWHSELTKTLKYPFERDYSTEVAEVASMFLEHVSSLYLDSFYSKKELMWALKDQYETEVFLLVWIAVIDKFQQEVYTKKSVTKESIRKIWLSVSQEFRGEGVSWENDKDLEQINYVRQPHPFTSPLYYIEYGISLIAVIQLLQSFEKNPQETLQRYNNGLSLGNTVSTKSVYEQGFNLPLQFGEKQVKHVMRFFNERII